MGSRIRTITGVTAVAVVGLLAGCDRTDEAAEAKHCNTAFERVTKDVRDRTIVSTHSWAVGDTKNISITYDGVYGEGDAVFRDIFKCTYDAPLGTVQKKGARIDAVDIMVRGKHMSEAELLLLNTAIHMSKPKLLP